MFTVQILNFNVNCSTFNVQCSSSLFKVQRSQVSIVFSVQFIMLNVQSTMFRKKAVTEFLVSQVYIRYHACVQIHVLVATYARCILIKLSIQEHYTLSTSTQSCSFLGSLYLNVTSEISINSTVQLLTVIACDWTGLFEVVSSKKAVVVLLIYLQEAMYNKSVDENTTNQ